MEIAIVANQATDRQSRIQVTFRHFVLAICLSGENDHRAHHRRNGINIVGTAVRPILQHNAARAHAGVVRGLTSDNVFAEYPLCAFAQCERARVDRRRKRMRHADYRRDLMNDRATRRVSGSDIPPSIARGGNTSSLLVDSAISHCEKLRRVLELKEWIDGTSDNPILATPCRKWKEERAQLLSELQLE
jgi:hypothetical protein